MWHAAIVTALPPPARFSADLNRVRRQRDAEAAVAKVSDVIVIGGGATGTGIALDAASRGLSVTLLESRDLAFGTSRWSSKLIHGGLRYLAKGDIPVAWESARERTHLLNTIAPHLIRALPHVLPIPMQQSKGRSTAMRAGLAGADVMKRLARTPREMLGASRRLTTSEVLRVAPTVDADAIRGGLGFFDGQLLDDARLVIALGRTAAAYGARILTRMRVTDIDGHLVTAHDDLDGGTHTFRGTHVIIATGVWSGDWDQHLPLRLSRGTHVLLRPESMGDLRVALTIPVQHSLNRFVFALPQMEGPVIAGLTDVEVSNVSPHDTHPPAEDIEWVLGHLSTMLQRPLTTADMVGAYTGFRPLIDSPPPDNRDSVKGTADVSRRHLIKHRDDGALIVTGGKLTTYRKMAADALDALPLAKMRQSRTTQIPLVGAPGGHTYLSESAVPISATGSGASGSTTARWKRRYGSEWKRLAQIAADNIDYAGEIAGSGGVSRAEVVHALTCEGALTVDDVVQRRTRVALQPDLLLASRREFVDIARLVDPVIIDVPVDT